MTKQPLICFILFLICSHAFGQNLFNKLKQTIKSIDSSWTVTVDTVNSEHISFKSGKSIGTLILLKQGNEVQYYIFKPINNKLENEINSYHFAASCKLSLDGYTSTIIRFKGYFLFLPMYPCWSSGYSKESKILINKLKVTLDYH